MYIKDTANVFASISYIEETVAGIFFSLFFSGASPIWDPFAELRRFPFFICAANFEGDTIFVNSRER